MYLGLSKIWGDYEESQKAASYLGLTLRQTRGWNTNEQNIGPQAMPIVCWHTPKKIFLS
jgi:hypothetical protein